jgi:predicted DNA-binding protein
MPSISIWLNSEDYKHLEELAKLLNRKPSKVIKEILEDKISFKGIENYYSIAKELYKWYYYEGNGIPNEKYIRRI